MIRYSWVFLVLFLFDFASKRIAIENIPPFLSGGYPFGGIGVFADFLGISFSLNCVVNTGAAWGLFSGHGALLFVLRLLIIAALSSYVFFFSKERIQKFSFLLVLVGAVSNALDYLLYGHVIDFFHFVFWGYSFPIFNLADAYITLGVLSLMILPSFCMRKVQRDV